MSSGSCEGHLTCTYSYHDSFGCIYNARRAINPTYRYSLRSELTALTRAGILFCPNRCVCSTTTSISFMRACSLIRLFLFVLLTSHLVSFVILTLRQSLYYCAWSEFLLFLSTLCFVYFMHSIIVRSGNRLF